MKLTFAKKLQILNILKDMKQNMSSPKFSLELDESTGNTYITAKYKNYTLSNLGDYALFINGKYIPFSDLFIMEEASKLADEILYNKVTQNIIYCTPSLFNNNEEDEGSEDLDVSNVVVFPKPYIYSYSESTDLSNVIQFPNIFKYNDDEERASAILTADDEFICF